MGEIISVECAGAFDPRLVRLFIRAPGGIVYSFDIAESDYNLLAMLPGFPPSPCTGDE